MGKLFLSLAMVVTLAGFGLAAQDKGNEDPNSRMVQGVVSDSSNHPVAGAVVQLKNTKTLQIRSFYTEANGGYHFAGLSTNTDYELHADHNGASSGSKTLSSFNSRKTAIIDLKLK